MLSLVSRLRLHFLHLPASPSGLEEKTGRGRGSSGLAQPLPSTLPTFFSDRILNGCLRQELAAPCWRRGRGRGGGRGAWGAWSLVAPLLGLGWKTQFGPASVLCSLGRVT